MVRPVVAGLDGRGGRMITRTFFKSPKYKPRICRPCGAFWFCGVRCYKYAAPTALGLAKGPSSNNLDNLTGSYDGWQRSLLVTEPFGYAPRARLASRQNSGVSL